MRPRTWPSASMTCHCRSTLPAVGTNEPMKSLSTFAASRPLRRCRQDRRRLSRRSADRAQSAQAVSLFQRTANQEDTDDQRRCQAIRRRARGCRPLDDARLATPACCTVAVSALQNCRQSTELLISFRLGRARQHYRNRRKSAEIWYRAARGTRLAPSPAGKGRRPQRSVWSNLTHRIRSVSVNCPPDKHLRQFAG